MKDNYFTNVPIYALATPYAVSAIAVFRVSGEGSIDRLNAILDKRINLSSSKFVDNKAIFFRNIIDPQNSKVIDQALISVFKQGSGYTKEEAAEISIHGSIAVINALDRLLLYSGFRLAERGEFTFRAFQNGTITLLESEAVLELIESDSDKRRESAIKRLSGALDEKIEAIYNKILKIFSIFELQLDYSDDEYDEDVEFPSHEIEDVKNDIALMLKSFEIAKREENGIKIVLLGDTNAGKSTLFNAILLENRSIVSKYRGTTRDYIRETTEISGHKVVIYDTAGLNESAKRIEKNGIKRTEKIAKEADIIIRFLSDNDIKKGLHLKDNANVIYVRNKIDKKPDLALKEENVINISAKTGAGLDKLLAQIGLKIDLLMQSNIASSCVVIHSHRQKKLLEEALLHLNTLNKNESIEILSAETQNVLSSIRVLLGIEDEEGNQEVLDEIFSRFCVGK